MADIEIGTAAFDTVTKGVANYLPYVTGLCYAIASIICLAGAMEIYFAYINEAQDVKKRILRVTFACVFFVASAHALPAFFGRLGLLGNDRWQYPVWNRLYRKTYLYGRAAQWPNRHYPSTSTKP